ncbi:hypothetical protein ACOSP7_013897 [Xanthoceras sorbifolium]
MERFLFTKLSMLIVIALVLQMHGYKGCLEKERTTLLEIKELFLYSSVNIDYVNSNLGSWVDDRVSDCCNWNRVECNTTTGRVINLSLFSIGSSLSLPILNFSMFQPFEELQSLDLSGNFFKGYVNSRANLRNLEVLDLSLTRISGSTLQELGGVPIQLSNIKGLKVLDISKNRLSGSIASSTNLSSVRYLYM